MTYPSLVRAPADAVFGTNERPKATGGKSYFHVMHDTESSDKLKNRAKRAVSPFPEERDLGIG